MVQVRVRVSHIVVMVWVNFQEFNVSLCNVPKTAGNTNVCESYHHSLIILYMNNDFDLAAVQ